MEEEEGILEVVATEVAVLVVEAEGTVMAEAEGTVLAEAAVEEEEEEGAGECKFSSFF